MCGAEALLIAITLATQLVRPDYSQSYRFSTTLECGCGCAQTRSAELACLAARAEAEEKAAATHNAKVKEFQQITRMCGIKEGP